MNQKRILILAGAAVHVKLVLTAKEMDIYTIVTDNLPIDRSPAKKYADESWGIDIYDTESIVRKVNEIGGVDGVLSYCIDPAQKPYYKVCEALNLPCYGTEEQFSIMTDKRKFKRLCTRCSGISVIPEYTIKECSEGRIRYPLLVKPAISRGSRGQTVCWSDADIRDAVRFAESVSLDNSCIIEKYMQGYQDLTISYLVVSGEPYLVKLADRYVGKMDDKLDRQQMAALMPSRYADSYLLHCNDNVKQLIRTIGVEFGPVFFQAFYDHETGNIYMYDPGLRFPGSDFDLAVRSAMGLDLPATLIRFALTGNTNCFTGQSVDNAFHLNGGHCLLLSFSVREGVIGTIEGVDTILTASPYVKSVNVLRQEGDKVDGYGDVSQRVVEICAYLPEGESVNEFIDSAYFAVRIMDDKGLDMVVSRVPAVLY